MSTFQFWLFPLRVASITFAITWTILEIRAYRRYRALCRIVMQLSVDAFMAKHLPIWIAWRELYGFDFKIIPVPRTQEIAREALEP